jgi:hypothetical protein
MVRLVVAPKTMEGIEAKLLQTHGWKIGWKFSKNHEEEKWSIQLADEIHAQRSAILIESNIYKMWKLSQHPPTLWRIGEISHFLPFPLLYHKAHPHLSKATMARGWDRDDWVLTSPPAFGVLFIEKLMTKLSLWPSITKMAKLR